MNRLLWALQILLALLFAFAGVMKFKMPVEEMMKGNSLPAWFFYFIGAMEILGALGLILPRLLKIMPGLTPFAAAGLTLIMIGAVWTTFPMGPAQAALPFVTGVLCAFVAYGRWRIAP